MKDAMKKNKFISIYIIISIISIITKLFGISTEKFKNEKNYEDFSDNWYSNNEVVNLNKLYKYDEVSKKIPKMDEDKHLYIFVKSIMVDVYIDDEKIYTYEDYNKNLFGKTPGSYFIDLHISREYSEKEITLKVDNVYNDKSGRIASVYFGNSGDIVSDFIYKHLSGIIFSVIIIFIGLLYFSLYFILRKSNLTSVRLFTLGLFAIFMGIFMLTDSKCLQLLTGSEYLYHMITETCMLLIVVPLVQFLGRAYKSSSNRNIINFLTILAIANFIICYFLNLINVYDYHESLFITHFTYLLSVIYIFYLCIKSLINRNKKEKIHNIGLLFICFGCVADIILFRFFSVVESSFFTRTGVLIFLCLEGYKFSQDFLYSYRSRQRNDFLQKLAYEDGLTSLLNRTSFNNDFDNLKDSNKGLIAIFDVNDLKKVNDKYGHLEGDNLILTFSSALNEYFSNIGKCYRIGGDEFAFLSDENVEEQFKKTYKKLTNYLNKYNSNSDKKYKVSAAMGYSIINKEIKIEEAYKIADDNMYLNKNEMKKNKKKKSSK